MAELFPRAYKTPFLGEGYYGEQELAQKAQQGDLQSQLLNLNIARERAAQQEMAAGAPLRAQQRQLQMGDVAGQIARQPDVLSREAALAAGAAQPGRLSNEVSALDLEAEGKVRRGRLAKTADEMDIHIQGFEPVLHAMKSQDYTAQNEAWNNYFDLLDKNGIDTRSLRVTPRDKLIPQLSQKYNEAVNNAPTIRERIKADQVLERQIKLEEQHRKTIMAAARERATALAQRDPTQLSAATSRSLEKYRKDPSTMTDQEKQLARDYFEGTLSKQDQIDYEMAWEEPERAGIRKRHMERVVRTHPELYKRPPAAVVRRQQFDAQGNPVK